MKLIKRILITVLIVVLCISQWSCSEEFLESYPKNDLSAGTFYTSAADFTKAVNGIYGTLQEETTEFTYFPMMDCATPYAGSGGTRFGVWDNGIVDANATWRITEDFWPTYYRTINRANEVLEHIDDTSIAMDQEVRDRLKGEALFLRGFSYFYLANFYGDVPLVLSTLGYEELLVSKSPRADVIDQVVTDLAAAADLLPSVTEYRSNTSLLGRASKGSAQALLGKLFVFEKRYAEAEQVLGDLITSGDYELIPNFSDMFWPTGENGQESIFEIQYNEIEGSRIGRFCSPPNVSGIHYNGFNYINPRDVFVDLYETVNGYSVTSTFQSRENGDPSTIFNFVHTSDDPAFDPAHPFANRDPRLNWTVWYEDTPYIAEFEARSGQTGVTYKRSYALESNHNSVKYIVGKLDPTGNDSPQNFIVLRYADVLLLYAEALLEQGRSAEAAAYINMIRARPSIDMPEVDPVLSEAEMRDALRKERFRELAFEYGHIYLDMKRWNTLADAMVDFWTANKYGGNNAALGSYSEELYYWPIPQSELDANPNITQNPGY